MNASPHPGGRLVGPHTPSRSAHRPTPAAAPLTDCNVHERARLQLCGQDPHDIEQARIDHELARRDRLDDYSDGRWPLGAA